MELDSLVTQHNSKFSQGHPGDNECLHNSSVDHGNRSVNPRDSMAAYLDVGEVLVLHPHDDTIFSPSRHFQIIRAALLVYDQAVVTSCLEGVLKTLTKQCNL